MITSTIEYKGFTIECDTHDHFTYVAVRFYVKGEGFKGEGYPSLNHAKGAITKYLAGMLATSPKEVVTHSSIPRLKSAEEPKADKASVPVSTPQDILKEVVAQVGFSSGCTLECVPENANFVERYVMKAQVGSNLHVHTLSTSATSKERLLAHYTGFIERVVAAKLALRERPVMKLSRNQREGRYDGKVGGKETRGRHYPAIALCSIGNGMRGNRKQRKAFKLMTAKF